MCESYREQRPLLSEDYSEDERYEADYKLRRPMVYRGWARNNAKGASAIITRWPGNFTNKNLSRKKDFFSAVMVQALNLKISFSNYSQRVLFDTHIVGVH